MKARHGGARVLLILATLALGACASLNPFSDSDGESVESQRVAAREQQQAVSARSVVNPFLWTASLETLGFLPITEASESEGRIRTEWYVPAAAPTERFRVNVTFTSRSLSPDAFSLGLVRQELRGTGQWIDLPATEKVRSNLEETILFRALQLRQESGLL